MFHNMGLENKLKMQKISLLFSLVKKMTFIPCVKITYGADFLMLFRKLMRLKHFLQM